MKKHYLLYGFLLGFICLGYSCRAWASNEIRLLDMFDEDDEEEQILLSGVNLSSLSPQSTRNILPVDKIVELIEGVGGFELLEENFYCRTNPLVQRNLLDLPLWELHSCAEPERWIIGGQIFWNKMDRSVFIGKNTNLCSYVNLEQNTIFNALDNLSQTLKNDFPTASLFDELSDTSNFQEILGLFKNFTVEQRRLGVMFHAWRQWQRIEMRMLLPFYYIERNLFATPEEKQAIENQFGALTPDEAKMFEKNHGISDRVGFGDFRLEATYAVYKTDTFALRFGGFLTIPTAFAVSKGIRGTTFDDDLCQPTLDLQAMFDLIFKDGDLINPTISPDEQQALRELLIGDICKNKNGFLLGALDRFNAIVLDSPLGNGGHLGIGAIMRSKTSLRALLDDWEWTENINWNNRLSLEYLAPANETRFFARRNKASDFKERDFTSTDEEVQKANLNFIEQEIVDKFYPYAVKTKVHPGAILRWFSRFCFSGDVWDITLGSDFWLQRGESLKDLRCVCPEVLERLDVCSGTNALAYQFKSVGSLGLKIIRPEYSFFFSVNAEGTSWNKTIGDDWTVSLNFEANF